MRSCRHSITPGLCRTQSPRTLPLPWVPEVLTGSTFHRRQRLGGLSTITAAPHERPYGTNHRPDQFVAEGSGPHRPRAAIPFSVTAVPVRSTSRNEGIAARAANASSLTLTQPGSFNRSSLGRPFIGNVMFVTVARRTPSAPRPTPAHPRRSSRSSLRVRIASGPISEIRKV